MNHTFLWNLPWTRCSRCWNISDKFPGQDQDILHQSINLAQICKVLGQWMRTWSTDSSKTKQKGQLASRIPCKLTKTPLVLILPRIFIQQNISILRGTSPFYILLKDLHTLDCVEIDNIPRIDLTEYSRLDLGFQISLSATSQCRTTEDSACWKDP